MSMPTQLEGSYSTLVPRATLTRAENLLTELRRDASKAGGHLQRLLAVTPLESLTPLALLGDVSVAGPVTIFDDGAHRDPTVHPEPFQGMLLFTDGALLENGLGNTPADWSEVVDRNGQIALNGLVSLYRRRLVPVFTYINAHATRARSALITVPGIGCGQFEHGEQWPNIRAIHFDPYSQCVNSRELIHGILFLVRPSKASGNQLIPQHCPPQLMQQKGTNLRPAAIRFRRAVDQIAHKEPLSTAGDQP